MIRFACPSCGRPMGVRDEHAGRQGKCSCGAIVRIPNPERPTLTSLPNRISPAVLKKSHRGPPKGAQSSAALNDGRWSRADKLLLWGGLVVGVLVIAPLIILAVIQAERDAVRRKQLDAEHGQRLKQNLDKVLERQKQELDKSFRQGVEDLLVREQMSAEAERRVRGLTDVELLLESARLEADAGTEPGEGQIRMEAVGREKERRRLNRYHAQP